MNRYRSAELLVETLRIDPEREPEDLVYKVEILSDQVRGKHGIRLGDPVWNAACTGRDPGARSDHLLSGGEDITRFEITVQHGRVIGLVYQGYHSGIW